jgi:hypothetical protein
MRYRSLFLRLVLAAIASAAPNAFPAAQAGYANLAQLGKFVILPSVALLIAAMFALKSREPETASRLPCGAIAGALATVALEVIRYSGFRLGYMPGHLPELMGVLLADRFALGPSTWSTTLGFIYHFWNGACFGMIFALFFSHRPVWWAAAYGILIGFGFLLSPVVQSLGVGFMGRDFGWHFAATVLVAHLAFGTALGFLLRLSGSNVLSHCVHCEQKPFERH